MRASIQKSKLAGKVTAPSSKSYTIRGLIGAALANGKSEIINPLGSDDTEAAIDVLQNIGVTILQDKDSWQINGGNLQKPTGKLFCRESAATLRFMTAICSLIHGQCQLTSAPSLSKRPIKPLLQALQKLGISCSYNEGEAKVTVNGGNIKGDTTELEGNISSQFVSALLFISPFADNGMKIRLTTPLESQSYILMTLECLKTYGITVNHSPDLTEFETLKQHYKPARYQVEEDWSSASYLLAMGALCGNVEIQNLNQESLQGDKVILKFLQDMGASVTIGKNSITLSRSKLKAIKANLSECIDLLPTVAVLAATAEGVSEFTGIERARLKESNRVAAMKEGLNRMGVEVIEENDELTIKGCPIHGAIIDSKGDHRIAMAFSLLGLIAGETKIDGAECISKTYPDFWDILKGIGGKVKINGK
ncbi:3-phosphoshikimate 1-carboxyvinyltransferase [Chloroflexota bacterium]